MPIVEMTLGEALEKGYEIVGAEPSVRIAPPTTGETIGMIAREVIPTIGLAIVGGWKGAAIGGAIGNTWSQKYRQSIGLQDDFSVAELGTATAASAIPFGPLAKGAHWTKGAALRGSQGAMVATAELGARVGLERGELPTFDEMSMTVLFGGAFGGTLGAAEAKFLRQALDNPNIKEGDSRPQVIDKQTDEIRTRRGTQSEFPFLTDDLGKPLDARSTAQRMVGDVEVPVAQRASLALDEGIINEEGATMLARTRMEEPVAATQRSPDFLKGSSKLRSQYKANAERLEKLNKEIHSATSMKKATALTKELNELVEKQNAIRAKATELPPKLAKAVEKAKPKPKRAKAAEPVSDTPEVKATVGAIKKAKEVEVDIAEVTGTGAKGQVTIKDVLAHRAAFPPRDAAAGAIEAPARAAAKKADDTIDPERLGGAEPILTDSVDDVSASFIKGGSTHVMSGETTTFTFKTGDKEPTIRRVLDSLSKNGSNEPVRKFSKVLRKLIKDEADRNVRIGWVPHRIKGDAGGGEGFEVRGRYVSESDTIVMHGEMQEADLLHEILHGVTVRKINKWTKAADERFGKSETLSARKITLDNIDSVIQNKSTPKPLRDLASAFKEAAEFIGRRDPYVGDPNRAYARGLYSFKNLDEFLVAAFTDSTMQSLLRQIKSTDNRTIYDKVVEAVLGLLGWAKGRKDLLNQVLRDSSRIISASRSSYIKGAPSKLKQTAVPSLIAAGAGFGGFASLTDEDRAGISKAGLGSLILFAMAAGLVGPQILRFIRSKQGKYFLRNPKARLEAIDNTPRKDIGDTRQDELITEALGDDSELRNLSWWKTRSADAMNIVRETLVPMSRILSNINSMLGAQLRTFEGRINTNIHKYLQRLDHFPVAMTKAIKEGGNTRDWYDFKFALRNKAYREFTHEGTFTKPSEEMVAARASAQEAEDMLLALMKKYNAPVLAYMRKKRKAAIKAGMKLERMPKVLALKDAGADILYLEYNKAMKEMRTYARETGGMAVGELMSYFPSGIKDYEGFRKYAAKYKGWREPLDDIEEAIAKQEAKWDSVATPEERAEIASRVLRRSFEGGEGVPSHLKTRILDRVDRDMLDFLHDPVDITRSYVRKMVNAVERRKYLGYVEQPRVRGVVADVGLGEVRDNMNMTDLGLQADYTEAIGDYANSQMTKMGFDPKHTETIRRVIKARFSARGHGQLLDDVKNFTYVSVLGNFGAAVTQLGDQSYSMHFNKFGNTFRAWFDKSQPDWYRDIFGMTAADIDMQSSRDGLATVLNWVLKHTGFTALDKFGKNTVMKSTFIRMQRAARNKPNELMAELEPLFGRQGADQIRADLLSADPFTEGVQSVIWYNLLKMQPAARSEMPMLHARAAGLPPGAREGVSSAYWLKTFTIKQFDVFREASNGKIGKAGQLWNEGKRDEAVKMAAQGLAGVTGLAITFGAMNMGTSAIKDTLYGRPTNMDELLEDTYMRLIGASRFHMWRARREGIVRASIEFLMPPATAIERAGKDLWSLSEGEAPAELYRGIGVGDFYYWHYGGGREKLRKDLAKKYGVKLEYVPK